MKTIVIDKSLEAIDRIIEVLRKGEIVILHSENVYGFVGNALLKNVVDNIYELKGRDRSKPLVYFTSKEKASEYGYLDKNAKRIIALWPEGIGIIVPKKDCVPSYVTAGKDSIMLVCVDKFLEILANKADFPIVGTSANKSGEESNIDFETVYRMFNGKVSMIIKGDKPKRGVSGSIVSLLFQPPKIMRVGAFSVKQIKEIIPEAVE